LTFIGVRDQGKSENALYWIHDEHIGTVNQYEVMGSFASFLLELENAAPFSREFKLQNWNEMGSCLHEPAFEKRKSRAVPGSFFGGL